MLMKRVWAWTLGLMVPAISVLLVINVIILGGSRSPCADRQRLFIAVRERAGCGEQSQFVRMECASWRDGAVRRAARHMRAIVSIALVAFVSISLAFAADDMKAFPPAEEGMTRHVISLPKQQDESAFKVELIIGKTVKTDASNSYFFGGAVETDYSRVGFRSLYPT